MRLLINNNMAYDYFVIIHKTDKTISGLSTFSVDPQSDDFICMGMTGDLPKNIQCWDPSSLSFMQTPIEQFPITKLQFLNRFTLEERISIRTSNDPIIVDFMELLNLAQDVDLLSPIVQNGLGYLVQKNLLHPDRIQEILELRI